MRKYSTYESQTKNAHKAFQNRLCEHFSLFKVSKIIFISLKAAYPCGDSPSPCPSSASGRMIRRMEASERCPFQALFKIFITMNARIRPPMNPAAAEPFSDNPHDGPWVYRTIMLRRTINMGMPKPINPPRAIFRSGRANSTKSPFSAPISLRTSMGAVALPIDDAWREKRLVRLALISTIWSGSIFSTTPVSVLISSLLTSWCPYI